MYITLYHHKYEFEFYHHKYEFEFFRKKIVQKFWSINFVLPFLFGAHKILSLARIYVNSISDQVKQARLSISL